VYKRFGLTPAQKMAGKPEEFAIVEGENLSSRAETV
jgi:hypothetical protein